jgi:hypothetical protein
VADPPPDVRHPPSDVGGAVPFVVREGHLGKSIKGGFQARFGPSRVGFPADQDGSLSLLLGR